AVVLWTVPRRPRPPLLPYTTLFRSGATAGRSGDRDARRPGGHARRRRPPQGRRPAPQGGRQRPQKEEERMTRDEIVRRAVATARSEEHTSELQSRENLVCRLLLEKK